MNLGFGGSKTFISQSAIFFIISLIIVTILNILFFNKKKRFIILIVLFTSLIYGYYRGYRVSNPTDKHYIELYNKWTNTVLPKDVVVIYKNQTDDLKDNNISAIFKINNDEVLENLINEVKSEEKVMILDPKKDKRYFQSSFLSNEKIEFDLIVRNIENHQLIGYSIKQKKIMIEYYN